MRQAFTWVGDVPAFLVIHPQSARQNRFVARWFEDDLAWALKADPPFPSVAGLTYQEVETVEDAEEAAEDLGDHPWVAVDAETSGVEHNPGFRVTCFAVSAPGGQPAYVWGPEQIASKEIRAPLLRLLADPRIEKVGSNLKSDVAFMRELGPVNGKLGDVRLWRKLQDPEASGGLASMAELVGMGGHKLEMEAAIAAAKESVGRRTAGKRQASIRLGAQDGPAYEPEDLLERLAAGDEFLSYGYGLVPRKTLTNYNLRDAVSTARLATLLRPRLDERPGLRMVWDEIVGPMTHAVSRMEAWGMPVSRAALDSFDAHLSANLAQARKKLDAYGKDFNPGSTADVSELLFKRLGLRPPPDTETDKGTQSVAEDVLASLAKEHQAPADILEYRSLVKMKGTYCDGMRALIRADGRIHPSFLPDGTRTGRCSSQSPNLQNIPRPDSIEGKMARDIFAAEPGHVLIHADYSQLELRILAMLSQDETMIRMFKSGVDFHQQTAEMIAPYMHWTTVGKAQRSIAKQVNFALAFMMSDQSLAVKLGTTEEEAAKVHKAILGEFRDFARWTRQALQDVRRDGYCRTYWRGQPARQRSMWRIASMDGQERSKAEHGAVNSPIQGSASDFCNRSMSEVVRWLEDDAVPAQLVMAIHDALLLHVREDAVDEVAQGVKEIMLSWDSGNVPLDVDVEVGPSWGSLRKWRM